MKNFIFKSTDADLQKIFTILEVTQKNVLYLTHQVDFIRKILVETKHDKDLQTTVDKYFDETSHQTDTENNGPTTDRD